MRNLQVEILVEEPSMNFFLDGLLPKILPPGIVLYQNCFIRAPEGKQDLQKQLPKKVRALSHLPKEVKVIVIQDQDSWDCVILKKALKNLVETNSKLPNLIRIACKELESWYLGDMEAIEKIYGKFKSERYRAWSKFRNPDLCNAFDEIRKIVPEFQKGSAAKEITQYLDIANNKSNSFQNFVNGVKSFLALPGQQQ